MTNYGIKVMKAGYSVTNTDIRNLILSSKYTMLKYHSDTTANLTITAGNTSGYVDFTHNLGYVPAFIAYVQHSWHDTIQRMLPFGISAAPLIETAFSTSSIVRCRVNMIERPDNVTFTFRVVIFKDKIA